MGVGQAQIALEVYEPLNQPTNRLTDRLATGGCNTLYQGSEVRSTVLSTGNRL
jgi:hypothetical protein